MDPIIVPCFPQYELFSRSWQKQLLNSSLEQRHKFTHGREPAGTQELTEENQLLHKSLHTVENQQVPGSLE
jgi:hypothetical protein